MGNLNDSLLEASQGGNYSKVSSLLKKGAEVNHSKCDSGDTALILASQSGHCKVVGLLLDHKADVNQANNYGGTALYLASFNGYVEVVELLIKRGAAINQQIMDGSTPLMAAAYNGHALVVVKLFLEHHADVNLQRNDGGSALLSAIFNGQSNIALLLLKNGADASLSKKDGYSPLILACNKGQEEVVDALLEHGASVNARTDKGQTALIEASSLGNCNMAMSLLRHQPDINAETREQKNALLLAILNRHPQTTIMLLEAGAKLPSSPQGRHWSKSLEVQRSKEDVSGEGENKTEDSTSQVGLRESHGEIKAENQPKMESREHRSNSDENTDRVSQSSEIEVVEFVRSGSSQNSKANAYADDKTSKSDESPKLCNTQEQEQNTNSRKLENSLRKDGTIEGNENSS